MRAASALFPAFHGVGADTQILSEPRLTYVQGQPNLANFFRLHGLWGQWNLRHAQVNPLAALESLSIGKGLPHIVVNVQLDLLCRASYNPFSSATIWRSAFRCSCPSGELA